MSMYPAGPTGSDRPAGTAADPLADALDLLPEKGRYPFHMPGHKRNADFLSVPPAVSIDITEIEGYDDLHRPSGIILQAQERAAGIAGAKKTWFLVGGSSCGVMAALFAVLRPGEKVLIARNAHRSAFAGITFSGAVPVWLYPDEIRPWGVTADVRPEQVAAALDAIPDIRAVMITSPTYGGIVSDVARIAEIAHARGIPLIVDEAHGAHLGYHPAFPDSAVHLGADVVVESLHKTLPALTQTAVLHLCSDRVFPGALSDALSRFQTSSPSYVLMYSIDRCFGFLEREGRDALQTLYDRICRVRAVLSDCRVIRPADWSGTFSKDGQTLFKPAVYAADPSRLELLIAPDACGQGRGAWLAARLGEEFGLEPEMTALHSVVLITSAADTPEGFLRLVTAVKTLDARLAEQQTEAPDVCRICERVPAECLYTLPEITPFDLRRYTCETVPLREAEGRISGRYIYLYPPGSALLAPGERVTAAHLKAVDEARQGGLMLFADTGPLEDTLDVIVRQ